MNHDTACGAPCLICGEDCDIIDIGCRGDHRCSSHIGQVAPPMLVTDGKNEWTLQLKEFRIREIVPGMIEIKGLYDGPYAPMGDLFQGKGKFRDWKSTISDTRHGVNIFLAGKWYRKFWYTGVSTDPGSFTLVGYCDYERGPCASDTTLPGPNRIDCDAKPRRES